MSLGEAILHDFSSLGVPLPESVCDGGSKRVDPGKEPGVVHGIFLSLEDDSERRIATFDVWDGVCRSRLLRLENGLKEYIV